MYKVWEVLKNSSNNSLTTEIKCTIGSVFTFQALPLSVCPYSESYCVPFPGMKLEEVVEGINYCNF